MTIYPSSTKALKGTISDQEISVLAVQDQQSEENNWNHYLEASAESDTSVVKYIFKAPQEAKTCSRAKFDINSMGESNLNEKWDISIRNYREKSFNHLIENGSKDWTWEAQSQTIDNLSSYINTKNKMLIKIKCKKSCSARDIDYMAITFENCDTNEPTIIPSTDISIGSTYNLQYSNTGNLVTDGFDLIDIDMEDTSDAQIASLKSQGKTVICYVNTGSYEDWRSDAASFDASLLGKNMSGWAGEKWLDISNIDLLRPIMSARFKRAKEKGCDAIHPDNIDGYSNNSGFSLTSNDQLIYNKMIAKLAHNNGMLIGLKNDVGQINKLVSDFDFAINESCYEYEECNGYSTFVAAQKPVFIIEYDADLFHDNLQNAKENQFFMIQKNWDLDSFVVSMSI